MGLYLINKSRGPRAIEEVLHWGMHLTLAYSKIKMIGWVDEIQADGHELEWLRKHKLTFNLDPTLRVLFMDDPAIVGKIMEVLRFELKKLNE